VAGPTETYRGQADKNREIGARNPAMFAGLENKRRLGEATQGDVDGEKKKKEGESTRGPGRPGHGGISNMDREANTDTLLGERRYKKRSQSATNAGWGAGRP